MEEIVREIQCGWTHWNESNESFGTKLANPKRNIEMLHFTFLENMKSAKNMSAKRQRIQALPQSNF